MNGSGGINVRFWGVRGSYPVPGGQTTRYGGNTACVEVEANGRLMILDAGTGIVALGRDLISRARARGDDPEAILLFSHLHHDHTQGFPFFAPAFVPAARLALFGPDFSGVSLQAAMEQVMQPPYFPIRLADLSAEMSIAVVRDGDMLCIGEPGEPVQMLAAGAGEPDPRWVRVRVLRSQAHPGGVLHYRVEWQDQAVVYATDTEGYVNGDRRLAAFSRGADLLIHDAQYTDDQYLGLAPGGRVLQGFGHSTASMACHVALSAGVKQLALFHHSPDCGDEELSHIEEQARLTFPASWAAYEGQEVWVGGEPRTFYSLKWQPAAR